MKNIIKIGERIIIQRINQEIIVISKVRYSDLIATFAGILFFIFIIPYNPVAYIFAILLIFKIFRIEKIVLNKETEIIEKTILFHKFKIKTSFKSIGFKDLFFFLKMTTDFATDATSDLFSIYLKKNSLTYHFITLDKETTYSKLKEMLIEFGITELTKK